MKCKVVAVVSLLLAGISRAEAQQSSVRMTTDRAVYKRTGTSVVKITLKNEGTQAVILGNPSPWSIWKGNQLVYFPLNPLPVGAVLPPGQSKTWTWNKKELGGIAVATGSYTVKVGPLTVGPSTFTLTRSIALTSSGTLAGTSRFPLSVGNEWVYEPVIVFGPALPPQAMKVAAKSSGWFKVTGLVGADRWARMTGIQYPTLFVSGAASSLGAKTLFRFQRPQGYSYDVQVGPSLNPATLIVGDASETVWTYAGAFTNCYRLDALSSIGSPPGYANFWFAPGIGLVQYGKIVGGQYVLYTLRRAKVKGSGSGADGQMFSIGLD